MASAQEIMVCPLVQRVEDREQRLLLFGRKVPRLLIVEPKQPLVLFPETFFHPLVWFVVHEFYSNSSRSCSISRISLFLTRLRKR